jgi:hypothetical protein
MITAAREGEIKCRNSSHFKRLRRRDLIETFPENSIPVEPNNDRVIIDHTGQELSNDPTSGHEENEEVIPQDPQETVENSIPSRRSIRNRVNTRDTIYKDYY